MDRMTPCRLGAYHPAGKVAIVVDSAASAPDGFHAHPLTFVVPMLLHIGDDAFRDGEDIDAAEFYKVQRLSAGRTSTSAPTPGDFLAAFSSAAEVAQSILCVTVSDTFSSTRISAEIARERFQEVSDGFDIRVLDSQSAAGGEGLIAWEALKAASGCASIDEVEAAARRTRERVRLLAYVDTLYHLWKSGRVSGIAQMAASLLKLKPIFELRRSEVRGLARPRTGKRAVYRMARLMADRIGGGSVHAIVMHADAEEQAATLRAMIESEFDCAELFDAEFTPVMGAHIGPGMVGVAFWSEDG